MYCHRVDDETLPVKVLHGVPIKRLPGASAPNRSLAFVYAQVELREHGFVDSVPIHEAMVAAKRGDAENGVWQGLCVRSVEAQAIVNRSSNSGN